MGDSNLDVELKAKKLELLNDHYKDSFCDIEEYQKKREWFFLCIIAVTTILLFQTVSPKEAQDIISEIIKKKLELDKPIDLSFIGSLIWFALLGTSLKYFQTQVLIERMYKYVHQLEDLLSSEYAGKAFSREGKSYLKDYPLYSRFVTRIYTIVFPLLLVIVPTFAILQEWLTNGLTPYSVVNSIFYSLTIILTVLYCKYLHLIYSSYYLTNSQNQVQVLQSSDLNNLLSKDAAILDTTPESQEQIVTIASEEDVRCIPENLTESEKLNTLLVDKQHNTFE